MHTYSWGFFNNFLMSSLYTAVSFKQIDCIAKRVTKYLNFYMPVLDLKIDTSRITKVTIVSISTNFFIKMNWSNMALRSNPMYAMHCSLIFQIWRWCVLQGHQCFHISFIIDTGQTLLGNICAHEGNCAAFSPPAYCLLCNCCCDSRKQRSTTAGSEGRAICLPKLHKSNKILDQRNPEFLYFSSKEIKVSYFYNIKYDMLGNGSSLLN